MTKFWQTARGTLNCGKKTLVMGILNVTPDSFSDGGKFFLIDEAVKQAEKLIAEGADILDIGGESTRPESARISAAEEIRRTEPVIREISKRFRIPVSIDTSKAEVAERALEAGAEIINDVSGLRFDERMARIAARSKAGLVLMHLRGTFETMHRQAPVEDVFREVSAGFRWSVEKAREFGVETEQLALDPGIGFGKTFEQNLELLAKLDKLIKEFPQFPFVVGTSRKSFIGKILDNALTDQRLPGSLASAVVAVWNGAQIVRAHDVRQTVEALKVTDLLKKTREEDE